jgi:hypothetical protein
MNSGVSRGWCWGRCGFGDTNEGGSPSVLLELLDQYSMRGSKTIDAVKNIEKER